MTDMTLSRERITSPETAAAYLAALIDGEGCVTNVATPGFKTRAVMIANSDPAIIEATKFCLDILGIAYRVNEIKTPSYKKRTKRQFWNVQIGCRVDLEKIFSLIPIQCPEKYNKLKLLIESYKIDKIPTKEVLSKLYLDEKKSSYAIAAIYNVTAPTVRAWIHEHGIKMRNKSEAGFIQKAQQRAMSTYASK